MRRLISLLVLVAITFGIVLFFVNFEVTGLNEVLVRRKGGPSAAGHAAGERSPRHDEATIRIGSFNIQVFGPQKAGRPHVMEMLADIARRFDVLAIQEIRSKDQTLMPRFVELVNATGARYDFVLGPPLGRTSSKEQYAFLYNTETLEVDYNATYTVADPYDRLHREPLVALFRARGPDAEHAFTFKLVNIHTDPDIVREELGALDDVYRAVLNDGDYEDDVIIIGDFNTSDHQMFELGDVSGITTALVDVPTNLRGTKRYDNIVFHAGQTIEFNGRAGAIDLVRAFNITTEQAAEVSDHRPIWAEFSIYEGGRGGRVASQPADVETLRK